MLFFVFSGERIYPQQQRFYNIKRFKAFFNWAQIKFLKIKLMKSRVFKLLLALIVFIIVVSGCSSPRYTGGAAHNRGVNNRHFRGY
jgi:hypothetical protein